MAHCRIGSSEIFSATYFLVLFAHCRIGSSENGQSSLPPSANAHCRIGSSETLDCEALVSPSSSLPDRQLRNGWARCIRILKGSLPDRQLRNIASVPTLALIAHYGELLKNERTMIFFSVGGGKSVSGRHFAYALAARLSIFSKANCRKCPVSESSSVKGNLAACCF